MKFIIITVFLLVNLQAGKVIWDENGNPTITGTVGQGCTKSGFGTEDNTTKTKDIKCQ